MLIHFGGRATINRGSSLSIHRESKFSLKRNNIMAFALAGIISLSGLVTAGASALALF